MPIKDIFVEVAELKKDIQNLSVEDLKQDMAANSDLLLLDLREVQETVDLGSIPGATHVPRGMLEFWANPQSPYHKEAFAQAGNLILFCASSWRSALAAKTLQDMGLTNIFDM